jgi:hypothetical protein
MRVVVVALALLAGCGAGPPAPDACLGGKQAVTLDELEIGAADEAEFRPILENATVAILRGPQGGDMVGLRLRLTGDSPPGCVYQSTVVLQENGDMDVVGSLATALNTYDEGPRIRSTRPTYIILGSEPISGRQAKITVECGGRKLERTVTLER